MNNLEKLESIQFVVSELVGSIRKTILEENTTDTIGNLEKDVSKFIKTKGQFCAGHNIRTLKNIIDTLLTIVKEQDKRISALESN
jgi:hypothetical protein